MIVLRLRVFAEKWTFLRRCLIRLTPLTLIVMGQWRVVNREIEPCEPLSTREGAITNG
jgi:hypothetical protein